jgi:hypothetical protein
MAASRATSSASSLIRESPRADGSNDAIDRAADRRMTSLKEELEIIVLEPHHGSPSLILLSLGLMMSWIVILLAFVLCASPLLATSKSSKCDTCLKQIDRLLQIYEKEHPLKHYPSTLEEFQNFAFKKGQSLDLSVFSDFSYERRSTRLVFSYTCKETGISSAEVRASITAY